jgi:hypothetical protein
LDHFARTIVLDPQGRLPLFIHQCVSAEAIAQDAQ